MRPLTRQWAVAWLCLSLALALHVLDEALTGFLPLYNAVVESIRAEHAWIPFPTFTFGVWLSGLIVAVLILVALTPLVLRGQRWLRPVSYGLGALMVANAIGHFTASIVMSRWAPGVYSSPVLLAAAGALIWTAAHSRSEAYLE